MNDNSTMQSRQSFQAEILSCLLMHVPRIKVLKTSVQSTCDASQLFVYRVHPCPMSRVEMNELVKVTVQVQYSINSEVQRRTKLAKI